MTILGISAFYHDSAAALIRDGEIIAAAQEERFTRKKHDESFPINAIKFCLDYSGIKLSEVDAISFYDKPLLKFERLLETYYGFAPKGLLSFLQAMPVWLREKMFLKRIIHEELSSLEGYDKRKVKLLFPEHHLSHAASAFYSSPFEEAAILTIDGVGEWTTASIGIGRNNSIEILKELHFPHSVGLLYSAFTYFLGFKVNSGEYKLMGLAPYGQSESAEVKHFIEVIKETLCDIKPDGSIWLNQECFNYATGLTMVEDPKWEKLFGMKKRMEVDELNQKHCNLAFAIQNVIEEIVLKMAAEAKRITNSENLTMAGGVALNCVANGKILRSNIFSEIFVQPASGDAGGAVGAAQAAYYIYYNKPRKVNQTTDSIKGSLLGPEFSNREIENALIKYKALYQTVENFEELCSQVSSLIEKGNVVGWFQGRMEFGPRALGNRSILGDPRNADLQKKLNLKIKQREGFRPFAPAVIRQDVTKYFDLKGTSPYMLMVAPVAAARQNPVSENYYDLPLMDRLYTLRSDIPAVTHVDFSARVQTVEKETNPKFYSLLNTFKEKTGCSLLVNTSFNVRGEPPVCSPEDAYKCFMRTEMDYLVMGNFILSKDTQPAWTESNDWKKDFTLD